MSVLLGYFSEKFSCNGKFQEFANFCPKVDHFSKFTASTSPKSGSLFDFDHSPLWSVTPPISSPDVYIYQGFNRGSDLPKVGGRGWPWGPKRPTFCAKIATKDQLSAPKFFETWKSKRISRKTQIHSRKIWL